MQWNTLKSFKKNVKKQMRADVKFIYIYMCVQWKENESNIESEMI